jgi:autotransporter-associated beta strand protein
MKSKLILSQLLLPTVILLSASSAHADSAAWYVDAAGDWATDENWNSAAAPGATSGTTNTDTATFGSVVTADRIVTVDTGRNISVIDFNANGKLFTLSGGSLVLSSGGTIKTSGSGATHNADTISTPITLANADAATSGTLSILGLSTNAERGLVVSGGITGAATEGASTLTLGGTTVSSTAIQQNKITGDIANGLGGGTLAVEKTGTGLWILEGAKTFSGGLTVREGELRIATSAAAAGSGPITLGDTTGTAPTTFTVGSTITPTNALTVASGSSGIKTLTVGNVGTPGFNGAITLYDSLTVSVTTANATNTNFTLGGVSGISLNANTLKLLVAPINSNAITTTITVNKAVSGTGALAIIGTGNNSNATRAVTLNGTNSYTGGTTVGVTSSGTDKSLTLNVGGNQSAANGGWTLNAATPNSITYTVNFLSGSTIGVAAGKDMSMLNGGAAKALNVAGTVTTAGTGNLNIRGNSTLTLDSGANWTQNGGFINIQPQNSSTNAVMTVNSGASFTYAGANNINLAKSNSGTNQGSATLNLSGGTFTTGKSFNNSAAATASTGTTNLNFSTGGTLKLSSSIPSLIIQGSTPFNVTTGTDGGIIDTNNFSTALNVGVAGLGGLTKAGAGTLTLNVANTYAGATTVSSGTLTLGVTDCLADTSNVSIGTGTLDVGAGFTDTVGTLDCTGAATIQLGAGATLVFADSSLQDWTGGSLNITGDFVPGDLGSLNFGSSTGLSESQLLQITASAWTNFDLDDNGYLTASPIGGASGYDAWATGDEPFDGDANGDGVQDGLAFLLGAATPATHALGLLPTVTQSGGNLVMNFNCLPVSARGGAIFKVEYSTNLASWTTTTGVVPDADNAIPDNNVTFEVTAGPAGPPALNSVTATIGSAAAAGSGKFFARLKAVTP